jgi:serine/threonine protein kinase
VSLGKGRSSNAQSLFIRSFGTVYRARHLASQNVIALKKQVLKENNTELVREIQIMEQMSSPYIVGYYGSCLDGEVMWIVCL